MACIRMDCFIYFFKIPKKFCFHLFSNTPNQRRQSDKRLPNTKSIKLLDDLDIFGKKKKSQILIVGPDDLEKISGEVQSGQIDMLALAGSSQPLSRQKVTSHGIISRVLTKSDIDRVDKSHSFKFPPDLTSILSETLLLTRHAMRRYSALRPRNLFIYRKLCTSGFLFLAILIDL